MAQKKVLPLNTDGVQINPATEEALMLLRRLCRILEPIATQDTSYRQRVVVDSTASFYIGSGVASSTGYVTPMAMPPANTAIGAFIHEVNNPIDQRWEFAERARIAYATQIRANISFS